MIGLSKSSLETFKTCPRCFWLEKNAKLKKPEGIKASIMDGIDDGMKQCAEYHARENKPIHYLSAFPGAKPHPDRARVAAFMSWRTFQATITAGSQQALIWGQVDDLIEWDDSRVSPWDFKSNGKARDWADYTVKYNSLQADMYEILLQANGMTTTGVAYFTYTWPVCVDGVLGFDFQTVSIETDQNRALAIIEQAIDCLQGSEPESDPSCEYCTYVAKRAYRLKKAIA